MAGGGATVEELKDVLRETLENRGALGNVRAHLRAEVSNALEDRTGLKRPDISNENLIINELIREIVTEMGATAMTITHDMSSVRAIADNIAMLHDGVIKWTGPVAQLDTSGDPYLDQFIHGRAEGPIEAVR